MPDGSACNYKVAADPAGWRVNRAEVAVGVFPQATDAIDQACRMARRDADAGRLAIVTTETQPQELHCYLPPYHTQPAAEQLRFVLAPARGG